MTNDPKLVNYDPVKEKQRRSLVVLVLLVVLAIGAFFSNLDRPQPVTQNEAISGDHQTALNALGALAIKDRVSKTGYSRDQFGHGWGDIMGCDVRNLVLKRDLTEIKFDTDGCTVLSGKLSDPYSDKVINFTKGEGTSQLVQIDHVVALSDAWQKGAQDLTPQKRQEFANDSLNLLAVDGPLNQQKSDSDASEWLPPNKNYGCAYVARQIAVKLKYLLWITQTEFNTMTKVLKDCPQQVLPIESG